MRCLSALLIACGVLLAATTRIHAAIAPSLTVADLNDAIRWARTGTPRPYVLYVNPQRTHAAGFVYTPFVRAAIAAKTAMGQRSEVTPSTVAPVAADPVVYVALDWYRIGGSSTNLCNTVAEGDACLRDQRIVGFAPRVVGGAVRGQIVGGQPNTIIQHADPAVWITRDLTVLSRFGGTVPEGHADHIAAVAAFPPQVFVPGHFIGACVWLDVSNPYPRCETRVGIVLASDLATWR